MLSSGLVKSTMSFAKGDEGELLWVKHLEGLGYENVEVSTGKTYWDVMDDTGVKYEVKYDEKAMYWANRRNEPPNFYFEYWSTTRGEQCGIYSLEAEYMVYIIKDEDKRVAYTFDVDQLLSHLESADYVTRGNKAFGDNNARGWTPPIDELIAHPDSGFLKTIELTP